MLFVAACASAVACSAADIANYNSPNTSQLEGSPNAATVNTTVAGVIAGSRAGAGTWASTLGIFGREIMNLDGAEPRNVLALLIGPLEPGGLPAGDRTPPQRGRLTRLRTGARQP